MELENNMNDSNTQFKKPSEFLSQIVKLEEIMPHILEDFKDNYVLYNKNSQNNENSQLYENIKSNIEKENSKLFIINNAMQKGIENLNAKMFELNKKIQIEKMESKKMKRYLGSVENEYNGSDEMINNYKEMYNMYYFKNFTMFFGIVLSCLILTKVFAGNVNK